MRSHVEEFLGYGGLNVMVCHVVKFMKTIYRIGLKENNCKLRIYKNISIKSNRKVESLSQW